MTSRINWDSSPATVGGLPRFTVHIDRAVGILGGPFHVTVIRHGPETVFGVTAPKLVAGTSGIATIDRAEAVARDYRAQYGVAP